MAEIKTLPDEYGIIHEANKILPGNNLKLKFLEALAELEDNAAHKTSTFRKTRLHKVSGKHAVNRTNLPPVPLTCHICAIPGKVYHRI